MGFWIGSESGKKTQLTTAIGRARRLRAILLVGMAKNNCICFYRVTHLDGKNLLLGLGSSSSLLPSQDGGTSIM